MEARTGGRMKLHPEARLILAFGAVVYLIAVFMGLRAVGVV